MSRDIERQRAVWDTYYRKAHSGARVYNSADLAVANTTVTTLTFNSERYDDADYHSTSSNTSRLTIPQPGRYRVGGNIRWASNATGFRVVYLFLNASTYIAIESRAAVSGGPTDININTEWEFAAGDYVELQGYQSSGGSLNVTSASAYSPEFWIALC